MWYTKYHKNNLIFNDKNGFNESKNKPKAENSTK